MKMKKIYRKDMFRPIVYLTAFRLMISAILLLILTGYVPDGPSTAMVSGFLTVVFALFAFLVYLRMDGIRIPRIKYIRPKKKKDGLTLSMHDHIDEEPSVSFEELEVDERDFCSLVANAVCFLVFLILSFVG